MSRMYTHEQDAHTRKPDAEILEPPRDDGHEAANAFVTKAGPFHRIGHIDYHELASTQRARDCLGAPRGEL